MAKTNPLNMLLCQPLALIPAHRIGLCLLPYPQDEAVYPRHSPEGCGPSAAACVGCRASLPRWPGTARPGLQMGRALPHNSMSQGLNGDLASPANIESWQCY